MLNVSIVWGVIVVSVSKDTQEMETTVQVSLSLDHTLLIKGQLTQLLLDCFNIGIIY